MLVSSFDFPLPEELVAQSPAPRGESRLMVLHRASGRLEHSTVAALPTHLRPGDLLVVNNTRVFAARLFGRRLPDQRQGGRRSGNEGGGVVECLLLARHEPPTHAENDMLRNRADGDDRQKDEARKLPQERAMRDDDREQLWDALMHPGQKLRPGGEVRFEGEAGVLFAQVLERRFHGRRVIRLRSDSNASVDALIDALGHVPLPPYIKRRDTGADRERYQTVYASVRGSVAAPTAGLHFTPQLLEMLARNSIDRVEITLHVGYGTFKPVRVTEVEQHEVDPERYVIPQGAADAINRARAEGRRVVAVGTTTTRALEDAAIRGHGRVVAGCGRATTFIYPGFCFQIVDALLTNFHMPRSSLLMLVSAFAGREQLLSAYAEAISQRYRFYSYGDAMLIT